MGPYFMRSWVPIRSLFLGLKVPISFGNSECVPVMFDEQQLIEFVDMLVLLLVMITRFYRIRQMRLEMTRSILLMNENQRRQRKEILSGT